MGRREEKLIKIHTHILSFYLLRHKIDCCHSYKLQAMPEASDQTSIALHEYYLIKQWSRCTVVS